MVQTRFALILGPLGCVPYPVKGFFEITEDMIASTAILLKIKKNVVSNP